MTLAGIAEKIEEVFVFGDRLDLKVKALDWLKWGENKNISWWEMTFAEVKNNIEDKNKQDQQPNRILPQFCMLTFQTTADAYTLQHFPT